MPTTGFAGLSRVLKSVIIVSLALNLLVIGALATAWYRHGGKHFHHGGVERSLMHYARHKLPRDRRRALRKAWHKERDALAPMFQDLRAARKQVGTALQVDSYSRAGVAAALDEVRQKRSLVRQRMSEKFLDLVETLTDDEKRALGQFIQEDRRGRWRGRHKRRRHHD